MLYNLELIREIELCAGQEWCGGQGENRRLQVLRGVWRLASWDTPCPPVLYKGQDFEGVGQGSTWADGIGSLLWRHQTSRDHMDINFGDVREVIRKMRTCPYFQVLEAGIKSEGPYCSSPEWHELGAYVVDTKKMLFLAPMVPGLSPSDTPLRRPRFPSVFPHGLPVVFV